MTCALRVPAYASLHTALGRALPLCDSCAGLFACLQLCGAAPGLQEHVLHAAQLRHHQAVCRKGASSQQAASQTETNKFGSQQTALSAESVATNMEVLRVISSCKLRSTQQSTVANCGAPSLTEDVGEGGGPEHPNPSGGDGGQGLEVAL